MRTDRERTQDRIIILSWLLFCAAYYLAGMVGGGVAVTSPVWYFESALTWIPFANFARHCLAAGIFPAWTPHYFGGFPILDYATFYGVSLARIFGDYRGSFLFHLLAYGIGGICFYYGLRKFLLSPAASALGLLFWMGGLYFNTYGSYLPFATLSSPVLFWGAAGILRDRVRVKYVFGVAVSSALGLACDPEQQLFLFGAVLSFGYFAARPVKGQRYLVLGIAIGFSFLLAFLPVLSLLIYGPFSVRGLGLTFKNYIALNPFQGFLAPLLLLLNPFPDKLPQQLQAAYPGLVCLFLFLLGIKRLGWRGAFCGMVLLLNGLYIIGWEPVCKIFYHIPIFDRMALHYSSGIVLFQGFAVLAAFGADDILIRKPKPPVYAIMLVALLIAAALPLLPRVCGGLSMLCLKPDWIRFAGLCLCLLAGLVIILKPKFRRAHLWPAFLLLAAIFDSSYVAFKLQPRARRQELADSPAMVDFLSRERRLVRFWPLSTQLYAETVVHPLVGMNLPLELPGTDSVLGYWRVPPLRIAKLINLIAPGYVTFDESGRLDFIDLGRPRDPKEIDEHDLFYLRLLNTGNIISRGAWLNIPGVQYLGSAADINFYRLTETWPRYHLVTRLRRFADPAETLGVIARQEFDPRETALVETDFPFLDHDRNPGRAALKRFLPGKWEFELNLPGLEASGRNLPEYFLVIGEEYFPGWRAYADGREVRVYRADYGFFGVALPAGQYPVRIAYHPWHMRLGLWATLAAMGFWVLIALGWTAEKRRGQ